MPVGHLCCAAASTMWAKNPIFVIPIGLLDQSFVTRSNRSDHLWVTYFNVISRSRSLIHTVPISLPRLRGFRSLTTLVLVWFCSNVKPLYSNSRSYLYLKVIILTFNDTFSNSQGITKWISILNIVEYHKSTISNVDKVCNS